MLRKSPRIWCGMASGVKRGKRRHPEIMDPAFAEPERHRLLPTRLLEELVHRQHIRAGGWSHRGEQFCTEATSLALFALSSMSGSVAKREDLRPLLAHRLPDGTWPGAVTGAGVNIWATALAVNALMVLGVDRVTLADSLQALVQCQPLEASWLVRLKFRFADRQVQFDPTKYGWPWVADTLSWVVPTSMALIALDRAKSRGQIGGSELDHRLRLGTEMLLDRACIGGGWNAGNAVVYGVPLRPHVDATAIALAALRSHFQLPIVRASLTWLLDCVQCPSAYSLAWLILAVALYRDMRPDVMPALAAARDRLAGLVDNPRSIQDTSTIALAALALRAGENPFEVNA